MKRIKNLSGVTVYDVLESPVGLLGLLASDEGLHGVLWEEAYLSEVYQACLQRLPRGHQHQILIKAKRQLGEYFQGERKTFDVPLSPAGTSFQLQAWRVLSGIQYGETMTYGEQAEKLGGRHKARAVGVANGSNPISIIIPCHRVIGAKGQLVGFGGGLDRKQALLELEQLVAER